MSGRAARYAIAAATIAVALAVGFGLRAIDSPSEARAARIDARRVEALNEISRAVDVYVARHGRLPANLAALHDVSSARIEDPGTGESLGYEAKGQEEYELCAVFSRKSPHPNRADFWWHAAGRQCYKLKVREPERHY